MLERFRLATLQINLRALEPTLLPEYQGSMLRGGFGSVLRRVCCVNSGSRCSACTLREACAYSYLFETTPPADATHFSQNIAVPRPYVFAALGTRRALEPGDPFSFRLTLIGRAIDYLPYFIVAIRELGSVGITSRRHKYELGSIQSLNPLSDGGAELYSARDNVVDSSRLQVLSFEDIERTVAGSRMERLQIELVTPTRIKWKGKFVGDLPFVALVQALTLRINALNIFHCQGIWEDAFRDLRDQAEEVQIAGSDLAWKAVSRWSTRQQKKDTLSGLVGKVAYQGTLTQFLPLLTLGQYVHLGSDCVFGCGRYKISEQAGNRHVTAGLATGQESQEH